MPESYVDNFKVEPQTLTDKSIVYDVVARNEVAQVRINCADEAAAQMICAALNSFRVVGFVVETIR